MAEAGNQTPPDDSTTNPKSKLNREISKLPELKTITKETQVEQVPVIAQEIIDRSAIDEVAGKRKTGSEDKVAEADKADKVEKEIPEYINKLAELPVWQKYQVASTVAQARNRAQKLNEYADNLDRHCETIVAAAADIAAYKPKVSETGKDTPLVLETVVKARNQINNNPLLKKSESITKLLLNIIDLHNTKETPEGIQQLCQQLGNKIIRHNKFSVAEKVQLTAFVLIIRDTMALMSMETLPALQVYIESVRHTEEYEKQSNAEKRVIRALTPAFRCCSAFTNWITHLPGRIAESQAAKWAGTLTKWGFNPGTVGSLGSLLNQEAVINSVTEGEGLPSEYPTQSLFFKVSFLMSIIVFGSTVYFYFHNKKINGEDRPVPTKTKSEPSVRAQLVEDLKDENFVLPEDHPLRYDQDILGVFTFLQNLKKDYFPDIEDQAEAEAASAETQPIINGGLIEQILPIQQQQVDSDLLTIAEKERTKSAILSSNIRNVRTISDAVIGQEKPKLAKQFLNSIINPQQPEAAAAAAVDDIAKTQEALYVMDSEQENIGQPGIFGRDPKDAAAKSGLHPERFGRDPKDAAPAPAPAPAPSSFRRIRKSKRKSPRKSVRKSAKKSPRKSVRKSKRKSVKKSVRKPVKKSVRKSKRKSVRKSIRKAVKKSVRKSKRKSTRKNKVMKKSR